MPVARPCAPTMRFGPHPGAKSMPSSRVTSISSRPCTERMAGISASVSRLTTETSSGAAAARLARGVERDAHLRADDAPQLLGGALRATEEDAHRGARRVERDEAAADHDDASSHVDPVAAVDVEQEVDRLDHAVEVAAIDGQVAAVPGADAEEDRRVAVGAQLARCRTSAVSGRLKIELDPEVTDLGDLPVDDLAWQAVLGNAVAHHAAAVLHRLEYRDLVAHHRQIVGARHARRARPDDRHLAARGAGARGRASSWPGVVLCVAPRIRR